MSVILTICPRCRRSLEIPHHFDNVICPGCAASFEIRRHGDLINLSEMWPDGLESRPGENAASVIESRLAEIDELIETAEADVEGLKSREQSVPLQRGCAFFGLFFTVILVISVFMLVGRGYVGTWLFYLSVATVVFLGLARIRRKAVTKEQLEEFRRERMQFEEELAQLKSERARIKSLGESLQTLEPHD